MLKFTSITFFLKLGLFTVLLSLYLNPPQKNIGGFKDHKNNYRVGLLPYRGFDTSLLAFLKQETEGFYQCKVVLLKTLALPSFAYYAPRNRYKADSLLEFERSIIPANIDAVAGLTNKDISTSKGTIPDWGVFGLGMCPGKACVISSYRLSRASQTIAQLKERLVKVVLHEIGHNLGLPHCSNDALCLMTDAGGTIKQVDKEKKWLCQSCRNKLGW